MSRSVRKIKIFGHGGGSEKQDKRIANRKLRRAVHAGDYDARIRDVSNVWDFNKDGKSYWRGATSEDMRK